MAAGSLEARVADRVAEVRERITAAGGHGVRIVAVTKSFGADEIVAAVAAGCDHIGENYAQEVTAKLADLHREHPDVSPTVHFIGQVQRNKVRQLASVVDSWDSVDRVAVAQEIARRAPRARVLVQADTAGEAGKGGCPLDEVDDLVARCADLGLLVEGLMTVGPTAVTPAAARRGFREVRARVDALGLHRCSMGMSADLEIAVAEGATEVRIGSALFGARPRRG